MSLPKLLYIAPARSTFVAKDIEILSEEFQVSYHQSASRGAIQYLWLLLAQWWFLWTGGLSAKVIVIMFGGNHAWLPALWSRMLGKKCYIILGGTDCVSFPSIGYGTFRSKGQGALTCLSYRLATRLLPVHDSLMLRNEKYYTEDSMVQGCRHWCKGLKTPHTAIHNGYDHRKWEIDPKAKQPKTFFTIAAITDPSKLVLKGIDLILEIAPQFPDCRFTVIGQACNLHGITIPENVMFLPFLDHKALFDKLQEARFYMQLSISEGFPNALCESMLAQCIPICSEVAAMPEIVGETGILLRKRNVQLLAEVIREALAIPDQLVAGEEARRRVIENYTIEMRRQRMLAAFQGIA